MQVLVPAGRSDKSWILVYPYVTAAIIEQDYMSSMKILYLCALVIHSLVYGSRVPKGMSQNPRMSPSTDFAFGLLM